MLAKANLLLKEIRLTMFVWRVIKSCEDFHFKEKPKGLNIESCGLARLTSKHASIVVANVAWLVSKKT